MRNHWVQTEMFHAAWIADLAPAAERPDDLLDVARAVIAAGERHEVLCFDEVPRLGWRRGSWPSLADRIAADAADGVLDLFGFTGASWLEPGTARSRARLAVVEDGAVVERWIDDPGVWLSTHEPTTPAAGRVSRPPLMIAGSRIRLVDRRPAAPVAWPVLTLRIATATDVWFRYLRGLGRSGGDPGHDNRALAERHTPRLNAFLAELAAVVQLVGGTWTVDTRLVRRPPDVGPDGVRLSPS